MANTFFSYLRSMCAADPLRHFRSAEQDEAHALSIEQKFTRGNTNAQDGAVITERAFHRQMRA